MGFMDKVKQKAEEYDLQGKAEQFADAVEKTTKDAVEKAGELAHDNRDKVASGLDKAGAKFDEQTDGKYHDKVARAKEQVSKGVDKLAERRPDAATPPPATGPASGPTAAPAPQDTPPQDAAPTETVMPPVTSPIVPPAPPAPPAPPQI
ncbi:MAG: Rv0909 family putative TA system antitoxin [Lapillicoccus sp.]